VTAMDPSAGAWALAVGLRHAQTAARYDPAISELEAAFVVAWVDRILEDMLRAVVADKGVELSLAVAVADLADAVILIGRDTQTAAHLLRAASTVTRNISLDGPALDQPEEPF
jgi:hypothetical protein